MGKYLPHFIVLDLTTSYSTISSILSLDDLERQICLKLMTYIFLTLKLQHGGFYPKLPNLGMKFLISDSTVF